MDSDASKEHQKALIPKEMVALVDACRTVQPLSSEKIKQLRPTLSDNVWTVPLGQPTYEAAPLTSLVEQLHDHPELILSVPFSQPASGDISMRFDDQTYQIEGALADQVFDVDDAWNSILPVHPSELENQFLRGGGYWGTPRGFLLEGRNFYIRSCIMAEIHEKMKDVFAQQFQLDPLKLPINVNVDWGANTGEYRLERDTEGNYSHNVAFAQQDSFRSFEAVTDADSFQKAMEKFAAEYPYEYVAMIMRDMHETLHAYFTESANPQALDKLKFFYNLAGEEVHDRSALDALFEGVSLRAEYVFGSMLQSVFDQNGQVAMRDAVKKWLTNRLDIMPGTRDQVGDAHYHDGERALRTTLTSIRDFKPFLANVIANLDLSSLDKQKVGSTEYYDSIKDVSNAVKQESQHTAL